PDPESRGAFPWHEEASWDRGLLEMVKMLGRLRHRHPALRVGGFEVVWQSAEAFAFVRSCEDERLLIVVNRGNEPVSLSVSISTDRAEVLFGEPTVIADPPDIRVADLPPWSGLIVDC
ncbi:MAG: DUF3459 domain-containing protein, partial [Acidimicrobiia bacterium]|nr:DUF3459 domain-containing protein [Acidimicrobiia bacterium]